MVLLFLIMRVFSVPEGGVHDLSFSRAPDTRG
jgi:hypothetical protein